MKKLFNFISNKYYFNFIFYIIGFSALAFVIYFIDLTLQDSNFSQSLVFSQDFLKTILIMMIGSIITIITITFSTIMVVLTLYSGQFSPRTLNDFLQRKIPLNILAYFIGISVFYIFGLALTSNHANENFLLLTFLSMVFFLGGIVLFAYYIHYVSKSVQINIYIDKLVKDAVTEIEKYQSKIEKNPDLVLTRNKDTEEKEFNKEYRNLNTGYLIDLNTKKLIEELKSKDIFVTILKPINEHIFEDDVLFKYQAKDENYKFEDDFIKETFILSNEPGSFSEYREKTMKLCEIAVRALSPGTNDPATAINCIDQLGFIFMKLSDDFYSLYYKDDEGKIRIKMKTMNYDTLLYDHLYQIILYGKQDLKVISAIIRALARISRDANHDMKSSLWKFGKYVLEKCGYQDLVELDIRELNFELKELAIRCGVVNEYKDLVENN